MRSPHCGSMGGKPVGRRPPTSLRNGIAVKDDRRALRPLLQAERPEVAGGGGFPLGLDGRGGDPIAGDAIALQNPLRGGLSFPSVENQTAG